MAERTCLCGDVITPHERERNPRRWCSEACRFRHLRKTMCNSLKGDRVDTETV